jgi:glycosyltransferase involved in cell wall biosynthesis
MQSCVAQTYPYWELIIVDDASTDETPNLIARYAATEPRIRALRNDNNLKLPGSLNQGFRNVRGDLLSWTSDDNLYRSNALEEMVEFLNAHPTADMVYTDYSEIDSQGRVFRRRSVLPPQRLATHNCVGPCFLYRRPLQARVGNYAEDAFLAEDYDYWLRAFCSFTLMPLPQDLYLYRLHGASLTETQAGRVRTAKELVLRRHIDSLRRADPSVAAKACLSLAGMAWGRSEDKIARRDVFKGMRCSSRTVLRQGRRALARAVLGRTISSRLVLAYMVLRYGRTLEHHGDPQGSRA